MAATETDQEINRLLAAADDLIGIVTARGSGRYGFIHRTFQEYHAACALRDLTTDDRREILDKYWDHPDWAEVWRLYVLSGATQADHLQSMFQTVLRAP